MAERDAKEVRDLDPDTGKLRVGYVDLNTGVFTGARLMLGTHTEQQHDALVVRLRASYSMLRQWKIDADAAVTAWDGRTVAQNMAVLKVVVQRFGNLADGMADLLQTLNADA